MNKGFKYLVGLFCFMLSGLLWTGCLSQPSPLQSDHRIEIEFWTLQMGTFSDFIQDMIQHYEASHPDIRIKWVDVPFSEGEKKALTAMLAYKTPDVINLNPDFSVLLAHRGALLDLTHEIPTTVQANYLPVAWQATSLKNRIFGVPWYLTSAVTLYNEKLLRKAGFSSPPRTYIELGRMAKPFKEGSTHEILMPDISSSGRFFRVLLKQGIPLWNKQNRLVFADHGAGHALAFWVTLYRNNWVPQDALTQEQQGAVDRYQSGTLALLLTGPNFLNIVQENAPEIFQATRVAPQFPESPMKDFSEMILVVPERSSHPKEAVEFALYVTNVENTLRLSELAPVLPPHQVILQSPAFGQTQSSDMVTRARSISAQQLLQAKTAFPLHPLQNRLNQQMDFYVQSALLGKLSPEVAMRQAQDSMNQLLESEE